MQELAGYESSGFWRRVGSKTEANVLEQLASSIFKMTELLPKYFILYRK